MVKSCGPIWQLDCYAVSQETMNSKALPPLVAFLGIFTATAAPITTTYDTFGTLSGATFGGTGIPNHAVAITTIGDVTLGLTAHARYSNPTVSNDGAGTFYAVKGGDIYSSPPQPGYARWNFGWYVKNAGTSSYIVDLLYDFDPATATDEGLLGKARAPLGPSSLAQDSWNLGMSFLAISSLFVTPPTYLSFNPNVNGEYSFALILRDASTLAEKGRAAINVNVVPDGGGTVALLGLGLGMVAWLNRRLAR